ncbi:SDR family NAD(P)-dependent oxidoreductase [Psychromonas ossibalaenae]|uniref:SDR family NAD(P)-dependent oxidoreductase n=1 Tax=Psychromonas ossibalaenae TaxID=444922 RepID=UPI00036D5BE3|nr:SDR family oxidoreductase [Psychromonas ossibalaenae]
MKQYVLITGASAGLGEEFAYQLAKQGFPLLLVARRFDRLEQVQKNIKGLYPDLEVRCCSADLSETAGLQAVSDYIDKESLSLVGLINNAGLGQRGLFSDSELSRQMQLLQVNISALVALTHLCIPLLSGQKNSFIINVASTAAFQAGPNLAVYYASKAFVLSFSEALHEELKGQGIRVSTLCPGATKTEFAQVADMSDSLVYKMRVMDKQPVVSYALANLNKAVVIPGIVNKFGAWTAQLAPRTVARKIAYLIQK